MVEERSVVVNRKCHAQDRKRAKARRSSGSSPRDSLPFAQHHLSGQRHQLVARHRLCCEPVRAVQIQAIADRKARVCLSGGPDDLEGPFRSAGNNMVKTVPAESGKQKTRKPVGEKKSDGQVL